MNNKFTFTSLVFLLVVSLSSLFVQQNQKELYAEIRTQIQDEPLQLVDEKTPRKEHGNYSIKSESMQLMNDVIHSGTVTDIKFPTTHPDAQWYANAGLGLFMHWGIHSVVGAQPSWDMISNYPHGGKVAPPEKYYALVDSFNPQHYNPDKWLSAAQKAGFKYAVLTTKHHDGYALWPFGIRNWN